MPNKIQSQLPRPLSQSQSQSQSLSLIQSEQLEGSDRPLTGFKNRRYESEYLKDTFPSGFQHKSDRAEQSWNYSVDEELLAMHTSGNRTRFKMSFMDWAHGSSEETDSLEFSNRKATEDPFLDVAGPYMQDIVRGKKEAGIAGYFSPQKPIDPDQLAIVSKEMTVFQRSKKKFPTKETSPNPKASVYHAPTELPKLTSRLANSKSLGNLNTTVNRATSYDKWLQEKHTGVSDKVWKSKGNDVQYNYSPYRSADRLQTSTSLTVPSIDLLQSISEPAPQIVTVHIYTRNEMMSSNKPINDQKFLTKLISPSTSLQTLRTIIVDDIIRGVDSSWSKDVVKMSITDESIVTYQSIPYAKINVVLQYYHPVAKTWRALQDDIAWMSCKQLNKGEVRLMYYLNSESEKYIHNYLEERRDAQMNLMRTVGKDHVSLRSLTEALDATKKKTNVDRREVSKPSSPTNQLGEVRSQVSAYSTVTKTNSLLTPHGNMPGQSVFYPKRNPDLDNLRSANSKVNSNRVKLAATLEDRLLKTRW